MYCWIMAQRRSPSVRVSRITPVFGSPGRTTKIERPPMPSIGLTTEAPKRSTKRRMSCIERVTMVGGVNSGNHMV